MSKIIGNFSPKTVNLLVALRDLKETFALKKHLELVGSDQGNLENIRGYARAVGLEDQVHFLGFVPRKDLVALYCGAFALTYISLFGPETYPHWKPSRADARLSPRRSAALRSSMV
ncbi:MAG: glycosyltransferase, partial [Candidatus Atribacteria bacterium]|nr:glycosyltransferase [Candidatus Atribacteria bacterium]